MLLALAVVFVVVLIISIAKFGIVKVGKAFLWFLKKIGKGIWLVISAPFRWIGKAIARRRERKREEAETISKAESKKKKKGKSNGKKAKQNKSKKAAGKRGKK